MRVGCQAAANQGRGWRQVGVAPGAEPRIPEPQLQVEWARGRGGEGPWTGPSLAVSGRAAAERALGAGRLEPLPRKLRQVGGSGEAEGPDLASGGAEPTRRPEGKTREAGSRAGGLQEDG